MYHQVQVKRIAYCLISHQYTHVQLPTFWSQCPPYLKTQGHATHQSYVDIHLSTICAFIGIKAVVGGQVVNPDWNSHCIGYWCTDTRTKYNINTVYVLFSGIPVSHMHSIHSWTRHPRHCTYCLTVLVPRPSCSLPVDSPKPAEQPNTHTTPRFAKIRRIFGGCWWRWITLLYCPI